MLFVVCWFFSKSTFSKNSFSNTISVSNTLDLDQARRFVGPGLGPNGSQTLSADDTSRQSVKRQVTRKTCFAEKANINGEDQSAHPQWNLEYFSHDTWTRSLLPKVINLGLKSVRSSLKYLQTKHMTSQRITNTIVRCIWNSLKLGSNTLLGSCLHSR